MNETLGRHQLCGHGAGHLFASLRGLAGLEHEERDAVLTEQLTDCLRVDEPALAVVLSSFAVLVVLEYELAEPLVAIVHAVAVEVHNVEGTPVSLRLP